MNTPICDFVRKYAAENKTRLHMPGHKGKEYIGCEKNDITEIDGADVLYSSSGIIAESQKNRCGIGFGRGSQRFTVCCRPHIQQPFLSGCGDLGNRA